MGAVDHHFHREDRAQRWRRIARHLRDHPEDLAVALANLDRWQAHGRVHPRPLIEWRSRIRAAQALAGAMERLLEFLAADNHDEEPLKSCSPFAGPAFSPHSR